MEQRSIFLFLPLKGLSDQAIQTELTTVLGLGVIAEAIVTKYLCQRQFPSILVDHPTIHRPSLSIKQFLIPLRSGHSVLFESPLNSATFQLLPSISS
jgi:hypothetical protein